MHSNNIDDWKLKGTTTTAIKCVDGVVMASDTRATELPNFIASKNVKKIHKITRNIGITIAGTVAEASNILDILRANANLYLLQNGREIPVNTIVNLTSHILFSQRYYSYGVQFIIGGYDDIAGYSIFTLDPFGSILKEDMIATGSGSPTAYGVLESKYSENIKVDEAMPLVVKAVKAAMSRNVFTGDNFNMAIITKEKGYVELKNKEIKEFLTL